MAPSLSHSLLLHSRWQLDRKRNRKGLKDLLLLSFSFKDKRPSDNFPQCSLHGGLCDQWLWESTGIWPTTTSTMGRRRRSKKKKQRKVFFFFLQAYFPWLGRSAFVGSIWVHLSQPRHPWGPLCPLRLQGLSVLQSGSLLLLWKRGAQACWLACLDHLKAPMHPFPCYARPLAHPRCPEAWLV